MNSIPLSCADYAFPLIPRDLALDLIAGLGFEGVDISLMNLRSMYGRNQLLSLEEVLANPSARAKEVASELTSRRLQLADVIFVPGEDYSTLSINHPDPGVRGQSREQFQRVLEFAGYCNARHLTILPGVAWPDESLDTSLKRAAVELAYRMEQASKVGLILAVEPHRGSVIHSPENTQRLLKLIPQLHLTLVYCHFACQGFSDADCEPLLHHTTHFHARGGCNGRIQTAMRDNTVDYARVLQLLKQQNYQGYFALSYFWSSAEGWNDVDVLSETVLLKGLADRFR